MNIVWSPLSLKKFEAIRTYLMVRFGQNTAEEFSLKLLSAIDLIAQNPQLGKKIDKTIRALVVVKQISIHYKVTSEIHILTLWDNRQMPLF
jgi:plasmid stabilization system protein ParE